MTAKTLQEMKDQAGIIFDEKIVALWYVALTPKQDWMAAVRELVPDEKYELKYRFRYHVDDLIFDSEDRRNWYEGTLTGTRSFVIIGMKTVAAALQTKSGGKLFEYMNDKGMEDFMRRFQDAPFVHMRQVTVKDGE